MGDSPPRFWEGRKVERPTGRTTLRPSQVLGVPRAPGQRPPPRTPHQPTGHCPRQRAADTPGRPPHRDSTTTPQHRARSARPHHHRGAERHSHWTRRVAAAHQACGAGPREVCAERRKLRRAVKPGSAAHLGGAGPGRRATRLLPPYLLSARRPGRPAAWDLRDRRGCRSSGEAAWRCPDGVALPVAAARLRPPRLLLTHLQPAWEKRLQRGCQLLRPPAKAWVELCGCQLLLPFSRKR
jgi:hypothetical protein